MFKEVICCDPLHEIDKRISVHKITNLDWHRELVEQHVPVAQRWDHLVSKYQVQQEYLVKCGLPPASDEHRYTFKTGYYVKYKLYKYNEWFFKQYAYMSTPSPNPYSLEIKVYPNIVCNTITSVNSGIRHYPCPPIILRVVFQTEDFYDAHDTKSRWKHLFVTQPDIVVCA